MYMHDQVYLPLVNEGTVKVLVGVGGPLFTSTFTGLVLIILTPSATSATNKANNIHHYCISSACE